MTAENPPQLRVAVAGPDAAGKSTLIAALQAAGYEARHPAQEHSFVPDMWQRVLQPDVLVFLDVSLEAIEARRPNHDLGAAGLAEQQTRLAHAREHCDLYLDTSLLTADEVRERVLAFLTELGT